MASTKLQKPANDTSSHSHEEHKFSQKISEMTAKVFGPKQQGHQETAKHCTTCHCPPPPHKKEHAVTVSGKDTKTTTASTETKKKEKEGHAKHTNCIELKKKEKQHVTVAPTKESNTLIKKENKDKPGHNYFSSMTDHLKEKVKMMKVNKDGKGKDSSSSDSDSSDTEHEASGKKKQKNKMHTQETKHPSK